MSFIQKDDSESLDTDTVERLLNKKLEPITDALASLTASHQSLKDKYEQLRRNYEHISSSPAINHEDMYEELVRRFDKRNCLILSGLPEPVDGNYGERKQADMNEVINIGRQLNLQGFTPRDVMRIGKLDGRRPRLLRFRCDNVLQRSHILSQAKKLRSISRYRGVFLSPDLTVMEQKKSKALVDDLYKLRNDWKDVLIRGGRIVERRDLANFQ